MPGDSPLVLIVEDDPKIAELLRQYLAAAGMDTACVANGDRVAGFVRQRTPALVLLDVRLPGRSGMDVCRDLRATSDVPIIMVTAMVEEIDRLLGLELGADDYICKPFSPREVVARVKALLRRVELDRAVDAKHCGPFNVDEAAMQIDVNGTTLELTPTEFRLLATFLRHPGRVYSRAQLLDAIHSDPADVVDRVVDSHMKNLRKKIADAFPVGEDPDYLRSVYGVGYRLDL